MLVTKGIFRPGVSWEFYIGTCDLQPTASAAIIFNNDYTKVLLTYNTKRN